ncbi:hypothetical protein GH714_014870 [Hevea brasiliensis]|uniref:Uncharacterized protein n=1 Tax=Hevea brasiliensis TaxID=3981 RepID=A0A6A6KNV2_HEVBR|nr:hypothetical protein GH714_014870 [Hevea brasiliensis]
MSQLFSTLLFGDNEKFESFLGDELKGFMGRLSGSQESSPALRLPLLVLMGNEEDALAMAELATDEDGPNTQPASAQLFEKLETTQENLIFHILLLLVRAYDDTDLHIQEEVLKKSSSLAKQLDVQFNRKKRGVTVTDSGVPEVKTAPFPNGLQSQALSKTSGTVPPASKSSSSWDEIGVLSQKDLPLETSLLQASHCILPLF